MDHPPLRRVHGLQSNGTPVCPHLLRHPGGHGLEGAGPSIPVVLHIYDHPAAVLDLMAQDEVRQELKCPQGLATPAYEQAGILSLDVNYRPALFVAHGPDGGKSVGLHSGKEPTHYLHAMGCRRP